MYIILNTMNSKFWNGSRYVDEYSDAKEIDSWQTACEQFDLAELSAPGDEIHLIQDYGLETEESLLVTEAYTHVAENFVKNW